MDISFTGKTALVTGAGKGVLSYKTNLLQSRTHALYCEGRLKSLGIGRETAKLLAKCGAKVIALTRTQSDLDSLKEEIPNLQTICVDLLNIDDAIQAVDAAGHIDVLVNNAAYIVTKSCLDVTKDDIEKSMLVCVTAPLLLSQVIAKKLMKADKSGAIVNISTIGTCFGQFCPLPYVSVKSALESVTKCFAVELAPHKIRVNCLLPGLTNTPYIQTLMQDKEAQKTSAGIFGRIPMSRLAESEEIAHTIAYLLSDKSSYITGQCIGSDGGFSIS